MAIAPNSLSVYAATGVTPGPQAAPDRAANLQLRQTVAALNQSRSAGPGREFSFSIDGKTRQPVVRIVDSATHELIEQIPSQYILDLAQHLGVTGAQKQIQSSSEPADK